MQSTHGKTDASYVMGHPAGEEQRLQRLGQLQYLPTKRLFEQAGIMPGMKVLDVGSGAGDVALLLAELVGPTGSIVGVDVYPTVLETARVRLYSAGFEHTTFLTGDIREVALDDDFDAVVGRNVLMYVADPAEVLRICTRHIRPGGVIVFQEVEWSITERVAGMPAVPRLVQQAAGWVIGGFRQARFIASLHEQGALRPDLSLEDATDVLWALTSYDLYRMLVVEQHREPERYETWLAQLLVQHLLASASG